MKVPEINFKLPDLPRPVAISLSVTVVCLVLFGVLLLTMGAARDDAIANNARLTSQITQATRDISEVGNDFKYVSENRERFEALLQSDRLVPHVRRTAIRQLQTLALQHGLTSLNYDFTVAGDKSVAAVTSQVQNQAAGKPLAYRISVENIDLKIGASLDGQVYQFIQDLGKNFPGAAVVQSMELQRASVVTSEMLDQISHGQDAGLVKGEIRLLWRTAQANELEKKP